MTTSAKFGPRRVAARDREIYRLVDIEGKTQREVAGEMKLSQPRVNAIVKRMRKWLRMPLPPQLDEGCREERLREHSRAHRMRLVHYMNEASSAWEQSKKMQHAAKVIKDPAGKTIREEHCGKSSPGNPRFLETAMKMSLALLTFDGMDTDGQVDLSPETRLPEKTELTPEEFVKEFTKFSEKIRPVVEEVQREAAAAAAKQSADDQVAASPSLPIVSPLPASDAKVLSELLSREKAANSAEKGGDQPVIEPLSEAIQPLSNVIEPLSAGAEPETEANGKGPSVFGVISPSIMENRDTPKTPDPSLPAPADPAESIWNIPCLRRTSDADKKRFRVTVLPARVYPQYDHYYDTRTGERIEADGTKRTYDAPTRQPIKPDPPKPWRW